MANQQNNKKRPLYKSFGESYNQNASSSKKMKKQLEEEDVYIVEYLTKDIEGEFCHEDSNLSSSLYNSQVFYSILWNKGELLFIRFIWDTQSR